MRYFSINEMGRYTNIDGRSDREQSDYLSEKDYIERIEKELTEEKKETRLDK